MSIKRDYSLCRCPYWSATSRRCFISRKGLLIPLDNQISIFCTSENHRKCRHYKEELLSLAATGEAVPINRRMHPRIYSEHLLTFNCINDTGIMVEQTPGAAKTINFSAGGMQIRTKGPLFHDSIIRFSYKKSAFSPAWPGLAKVKWCYYDPEIAKYTSGLCFYRFKNNLRKIQSG